MEPANSFDLDTAISQYISQVNSAKILSEEEKDQIYDHFCSEAASLQDSGLSTEEAFFIAKMRFGDSSTIQQEFAKAKPWNSLLQIVLVAVVLVLGIKLVLNVANVFSFSIVIALREFSATRVENYLNVGDWIFRIGVIIALLYLGYIIFTKVRITYIRHLWAIPTLFILSEVAIRAMMQIFFDTFTTGIFTTYYLHSSYIYFGVSCVVIIFSMWFLYKNKDQQIKFA